MSKGSKTPSSSDKPKQRLLYWNLTFGITGFGKVHKGELVTKKASDALEANGTPIEVFTYTK